MDIKCIFVLWERRTPSNIMGNIFSCCLKFYTIDISNLSISKGKTYLYFIFGHKKQMELWLHHCDCHLDFLEHILLILSSIVTPGSRGKIMNCHQGNFYD